MYQNVFSSCDLIYVKWNVGTKELSNLERDNLFKQIESKVGQIN